VVNTAKWDPQVNLKEKNFAVIGSGASAVQIIPEIVPEVKKLVSKGERIQCRY